MSAAEFVDWMAYAAIEPLPQTRADLRAAMQMWLLLSVNRRKGGKKVKLEAFIPDWWRDKRDPRRLAAKFRALTAHLDQEPSDDDDTDPEPPVRMTRGNNGKRA